jgi:hypothetical protein
MLPDTSSQSHSVQADDGPDVVVLLVSQDVVGTPQTLMFSCFRIVSSAR